MNKFFSYLFIICCIPVLFACNKEFSVETGSLARAEGSLWDSTGNCLPDSVYGTFYNGITAGSDTAFVAVQVNVNQTGSYSITSDLQNGFQFFDSGFFSKTGINTIHLKPLGAAILPVPTTFLISFDSTFCDFTINVQDSTGTGLGNDTTGTGGGDPDSVIAGNWQFTTGDGTFEGTFDTAAIFTDTTIWLSGGKMLVMAGYINNSLDTAVTLIAYLPSGVITPGTYSTQLLPPANAAIFGFNLTLSGDPIYDAIPDNNTTPSNITIEITSYDEATNTLTGTFSGIADDANGDPTITLTAGSFTAKVTP